MPADVVMYKTRFCPYCTRASALLKQKGVLVTEIDVSNDDAKRDWLVEATGRRTVPQIFINGVPVGGFDDIAALDRKAMLDPMLREDPPQKAGAPPAP